MLPPVALTPEGPSTVHAASAFTVVKANEATANRGAEIATEAAREAFLHARLRSLVLDDDLSAVERVSKIVGY